MAQKDPSLGARFSKIRSVFCDGKNLVFAQKIGVSAQNASGYCNGNTAIGPKIIDQTLAAFPQVSRAWLVLGEGDMIRAENNNSEVDNNSPVVNNGMQQNETYNSSMDVINRLVTIIENKDRQVASLISMLNAQKEKE